MKRKIITLCFVLFYILCNGYGQNKPDRIIKNKITGKEWVIHEGQTYKIVRKDGVAFPGIIIFKDTADIVDSDEIKLRSQMNGMDLIYPVHTNDIESITPIYPMDLSSYYKSVIKTEFFQSIQYEQFITKYFSVQLEYSNLNMIPSFFGGSFLSGNRYSAEIRIYATPCSPVGLYIAPFYTNAHGVAYTQGSDYNASGTFNLNWQGPGVHFGMEILIGKIIALNIYGGPAFYTATNSNLVATGGWNDGQLKGYTGFPYGGTSISVGFTFGIAL